MRDSELERLLARVDELEELRGRVRRARALAEHVDADERVVAATPALIDALERAGGEAETVARELERQWVEQGPLVALWQRAVDLAEQAASAGVDVAPYRADAEAARGRVERARLATRETRERLLRVREELVDALLAAPFETELPPAPGDDPRPEAARREVLGLAEAAAEAARRTRAEEEGAESRLGDARAELAELGAPGELERLLEALERELPRRVDVGEEMPPSVALRLARAGIEVAGSPAA